MASSLTRTFAVNFIRACTSSIPKRTNSSFMSMCSKITPQHGISRSYVALCKSISSVTSNSNSVHRGSQGGPCGCCSLHTEGDKHLIQFLNDEVEYEKQNRKECSNDVDGFDVATRGPEVTLTKQLKGDTITVKFNVAMSSSDDFTEEGTEQSEEVPQVVSKPPFVVEVRKQGSNECLAIQCSFESMHEEEIAETDDAAVDPFIIEQIAILDTNGEWNEKTYCIDSENMGGDMYDLLMDMLNERGITDTFTNAMIQFSTSYEHNQYVSFLKSLNTFLQK